MQTCITCSPVALMEQGFPHPMGWWVPVQPLQFSVSSYDIRVKNCLLLTFELILSPQSEESSQITPFSSQEGPVPERNWEEIRSCRWKTHVSWSWNLIQACVCCVCLCVFIEHLKQDGREEMTLRKEANKESQSWKWRPSWSVFSGRQACWSGSKRLWKNEDSKDPMDQTWGVWLTLPVPFLHIQRLYCTVSFSFPPPTHKQSRSWCTTTYIRRCRP